MHSTHITKLSIPRLQNYISRNNQYTLEDSNDMHKQPTITPPYTNVHKYTMSTTTIHRKVNNNTTYLNLEIDMQQELKYPTNRYYIDGSFIPPNPSKPNIPSNVTSFGINNKDKNINP
jgi:hypothetical protein